MVFPSSFDVDRQLTDHSLCGTVQWPCFGWNFRGCFLTADAYQFSHGKLLAIGQKGAIPTPVIHVRFKCDCD